MSRMTKEQRDRITRESKGKVIDSLEYDEEGYWVMTFKDGSEIAFRFIAEIMM